MKYSIIFKEPCTSCDHGVLPYMESMGYDECDCDYGFIHTEIDVTEYIYGKIRKIVTAVLDVST